MDPTQVARSLQRRAPALAAELVGSVWEHLPGYEPSRLDREDLAAVVEPNIRALLGCVADHRLPDDTELAVATALGERRALQGVPMEGLLGSWHTAERFLLRQLVGPVGPLDPAEFGRVSGHLSACIDALADAASLAYRRTRDETSAHFDQVGADLVSRLASGEPMDASQISERARLIGIDPGRPHRAVALSLGPDPAAGADEVSLARVRRDVLTGLTQVTRRRVLSGNWQGRLLLVAADVGPALVDALERAVRETRAESGACCGLGGSRSALGEVAASCREALEAVLVAEHLHATRTVTRHEHVVCEVLLTQQPQAAVELVRSVLGELTTQPALVATLRTYLGSGLSVRRTAEQLAVHQNTVSYRLRRIVELTGRSPTGGLLSADVLLGLRALDLGLAPGDAGRG
ncbi:MAG: PucR family transcriptional regulator [Mycobacteriales bacterium]